jgi:hypothetical protein
MKIPQNILDDLQTTDRITQFSSEYPLFDWSRSTTAYDNSENYEFCHNSPLFHRNISMLIIRRGYLRMSHSATTFASFGTDDILDSADKIMNDLTQTKSIVEDTLEKSWNAGYRAEEYIIFAMGYGLNIARLFQSSPVFIDLLTHQEGNNYTDNSYRIIGLAAIMDNEEEILYMLDNLPTEVIDALIYN